MYSVSGIMKRLLQGSWKTGTIWLLLFLATPAALRAGAAAALPFTADGVSASVSSHFAIADFDGDNKPDFASVQDGQANTSTKRYWIGLRLSTGPRQFLGITAPVGGLQLVLRDVNGDNALDLIVTTTWLNRPIAVLVNDGHGNFAVSDPANFPAALGSSEMVWKELAVTSKDFAAVPASRNFSGDAGANARGASLGNARRGLLRTALSGPDLVSVVSVLGRAPPACIL